MMNQETKNNGTAKKQLNKKNMQQHAKTINSNNHFCLLFRSLYRGLIFGDGAGLDNMGFAIEGSWRGESSLAKSHGFRIWSWPWTIDMEQGVSPTQDASHKWRFRSGFPAKNGIFLVVTGGYPQDMELKMQIWKMVFLFPGWSCLEEFWRCIDPNCLKERDFQLFESDCFSMFRLLVASITDSSLDYLFEL